jgi:hypothetical protein
LALTVQLMMMRKLRMTFAIFDPLWGSLNHDKSIA